MKINSFKKYFLITSIVFLLCLTSIVLILSVLVNDYMSKDKFENMGMICDEVSNYVLREYRSISYRRNVYYISRAVADTQNDILVLVSDSQGDAISCTCEDFQIEGNCVHTENDIPDDIINKVQNGRVNEITWFEESFDELSYITADLVRNPIDNSNVGYIIIASKASSLSGFYTDLVKIYVFSAIFPILIMFFVLFFFTRRWNKPLRLMSEAAKAMSKGDFSKRIPVTSNDEIGTLAASFNQMTNSLAELETMRRGFIANVSHELKTPMTTISGFIDGIIDGTIEENDKEHYLKIVSSEVKRLSRLVQNMLSLSKLESGNTQTNFTEFDFCKLLFEIVISQEQKIESRNLTLVGLDSIDSYTLCADRDLIYQVIYNLCDNAFKFTNEGGIVEFSISKNDDTLNFSIRNTGQGISQEDLPFVFDRFYKADKSRSQVKDSTGLGLFLVKTIVNLHNGNVFVSSKENEYTEFSVCLPLKK